MARTQGAGEYHAIQCKLYAEDYRIQKKDIDSFFTSSGKKRGYVVLPVVIPAGMEPHEELNDNQHFKVVWQVHQILRLKAELIHGEEFRNDAELRMALSGHINQFYSRSRLHSALDHLSPVEFERMAA